MSETQRYDERTQTMWLYRDYADPDTLVPDEEARQWSKALREGKGPQGRALRAVHYVFAHEDTAEYNHHALAFARLGTYTGTLEDPKAWGDDDAPSFETKEDFGI